VTGDTLTNDQLIVFLDLIQTSMQHASTYLGIEKEDLHNVWLVLQLRCARHSV
jgi:hypothetical protein